jgi:hypothetical protein
VTNGKIIGGINKKNSQKQISFAIIIQSWLKETQAKLVSKFQINSGGVAEW